MFSLGLVLVVVAGAELFTGNNLIVMAWADRRIPLGRLLRNWGIVYLGNLVGALATALLVFAARQYEFGDGAVGLNASRSPRPSRRSAGDRPWRSACSATPWSAWPSG